MNPFSRARRTAVNQRADIAHLPRQGRRSATPRRKTLEFCAPREWRAAGERPSRGTLVKTGGTGGKRKYQKPPSVSLNSVVGGAKVASVDRLAGGSANRTTAIAKKVISLGVGTQQFQTAQRLALADTAHGHERRKLLSARARFSLFPVVDRQCRDADQAGVIRG